MFTQIYSKREFIIFKVDDGNIVYNTFKDFSEGHTHLKSFSMAKTLIDLAIHQKIPRSHSNYILHSLMRISSDRDYIRDIEVLIHVRENKGSKPQINKRGMDYGRQKQRIYNG